MIAHDPVRTFLMWQLMMSAMMLPVVVPWIRTFWRLAAAGNPPAGAPRTGRGQREVGGATARAVASGRRSRRSLPVTWVPLFALGYFIVWAAFSAAGTAAQGMFATVGWIGPELRATSVLGGTLLIGAGVYQLTPLKAACLRHCRNPLGFFLARWRNGPRGALFMGVAHGTFCLGCCWALMALAFVLGVMNVAWMALLATAVSAEALGPRGPAVSTALAGVLVLGGVLTLVA